MHVLSIGSSVIDLFVEPDHDFYHQSGEKIEFNLGDKVPTNIKGFGVGGNGANVAVALTRLEIPTSFYTYLGNDALSREIDAILRNEGVEVIADNDRTDTPPLSIIFDFDSDRIIYSHHQKKEYGFEAPDGQAFDFIYLTSIGRDWTKAYSEVLAYSKQKNVPIAFSPGSHQLEDFNETAKNVLAASKIFFGNKEEAEIILDIERGKGEVKDLLKRLREIGPEIVSITDAEKGAYSIDGNGKIYHINIMPDPGPEKTGAGDSYASGFFASFLHGDDIQAGMRWGTLNAHNVMKQAGAQKGLLTKAKMEKEVTDNNLEVEILE